VAKNTTKTTQNNEILYKKEQLITFRKYSGKIDILGVILDADKSYSYKQVDDLIQEFLEGKVI